MNETKPKTRESIEYEKALKTLHELSLKKALSEEGVNTSKVSRQKTDEIRRLVDKQVPVRQKYQEIITKAQQESSAIITKAQQEMQAELAEIQKEVEEIIKSIKIEQGIIIPVIEVPQTQPETEPEKESVEEEVKKEPEAGEPLEETK